MALEGDLFATGVQSFESFIQTASSQIQAEKLGFGAQPLRIFLERLLVSHFCVLRLPRQISGHPHQFIVERLLLRIGHTVQFLHGAIRLFGLEIKLDQVQKALLGVGSEIHLT